MSKKDKNFYKSGNKKFDEGDYQRAIDDYSKAIELDPENLEIYIKRGNAKCSYCFFGKYYQGAIDDYLKVIDLIPNKSDKKILELRSKAYQILSKIDLDNSQSL